MGLYGGQALLTQIWYLSSSRLLRVSSRDTPLQQRARGIACLLHLSLTFLLFSSFQMGTLVLLERQGTGKTVGPLVMV